MIVNNHNVRLQWSHTDFRGDGASAKFDIILSNFVATDVYALFKKSIKIRNPSKKLLRNVHKKAF